MVRVQPLLFVTKSATLEYIPMLRDFTIGPDLATCGRQETEEIRRFVAKRGLPRFTQPSLSFLAWDDVERDTSCAQGYLLLQTGNTYLTGPIRDIMSRSTDVVIRTWWLASGVLNKGVWAWGYYSRFTTPCRFQTPETYPVLDKDGEVEFVNATREDGGLVRYRIVPSKRWVWRTNECPPLPTYLRGYDRAVQLHYEAGARYPWSRDRAWMAYAGRFRNNGHVRVWGDLVRAKSLADAVETLQVKGVDVIAFLAEYALLSFVSNLKK